MVAVTVQSVAPGEVSHGQCYSSVEGLAAGAPVRISTDSAAIHCRLAWDLVDRFPTGGRVALDQWQCTALQVSPGSVVELSPTEPDAVPAAEWVELRLTRWIGEPPEDGSGLVDFLRSGRYLLYPGLRFAYRPLGEGASGDYEVTTVIVAGEHVAVAQVGETLDHQVRLAPDLARSRSTYDDLGGLDPTIALLRREVELPLRRPGDLRAIGVAAPSGVLLYGPPGTGKTRLARAVANHSCADVTFLSGPTLATQSYAEAEGTLRAALTPGGTNDGVRLVVIDDIDYLVPSRDVPGTAAPLLGLVQNLLDVPGRPAVIATTSRRSSIDPAILRLGRVGRQVPVPVPSESDRRAILTVHTRDLSLATDEASGRDRLLADLAGRTAGFVGADLEALSNEAGRIALRRIYALDDAELPTPHAPLEIREDDWHEALTTVTPSAIGDIVSEVPPTGFEDVAGLASTVEALTERLILPLSRPEVFAEANIEVERGLLLYGPPGTGKTLLAKAVAHECGRPFLAVRGPELLNKWFGESEHAVRDLFDRARSVAPSIVFFDEIEAVAPRRSGGALDSGAADRVVNQLLAELDGVHDLRQVSVIGATNNPAGIDPAILRPGRLGLHIEVPLPDHEGRLQLIAMYLGDEGVQAQHAEYAEMTAGMSGADIAMVGREARLHALRRTQFEVVSPLTHDDVLAGLETMRRSISRTTEPTALRALD
jgi:transitional endoplasmic reticulum ATPase